MGWPHLRKIVVNETNSQIHWLEKGRFIVSLVSIILVLLTWVVPVIVVEAVLVSLAGIFIGPNYPLLITYAALPGLIPRKIQVVSITIMTAFGSTGGALFPFIVGVLLQKLAHLLCYRFSLCFTHLWSSSGCSYLIQKDKINKTKPN